MAHFLLLLSPKHIGAGFPQNYITIFDFPHFSRYSPPPPVTPTRTPAASSSTGSPSTATPPGRGRTRTGTGSGRSWRTHHSKSVIIFEREVVQTIHFFVCGHGTVKVVVVVTTFIFTFFAIETFSPFLTILTY